MVKNDLNDAIPFVHVYVKKSERSTVSDQNGLYTIIVEPSDTVIFSNIGFKRVKIAIPPTLSTRHMVREVRMDVDTVMLNTVMIFPGKHTLSLKQLCSMPNSLLTRKWRLPS
ncbi:MAG: hypothetical protein HC905_00780 [Bacteroidales bacterium]|nr:hypothetical protein [Bacteroidales bacterium]